MGILNSDSLSIPFNPLALLPFANGYYLYTTLICFLDCK